MRLIALLAALCAVPAAAQWTEFVEQYGREVPYSYDPVKDQELKAAFFSRARQAYETYVLLIATEMKCRNFGIASMLMSDAARNPMTFSARVVVQKGGLQYTIMISFGDPFQWSPVEFADRAERDWRQKREMLLAAPWLVRDEAVWNVQILSWREMFLYEEPPKRCDVVFERGVVCTPDVAAGSFRVVYRSSP